MAYLTPKTDWDEDYPNTPEDMNRVEGNIKNLKSETTTIDGEKTFSQPINAPSINTGHGDNEVYEMDQDVKTTDSPTFDGMLLTGAFQPVTPGVEGSQVIAASGTYVLPRGIYMINFDGSIMSLEIYVNSAWTSTTSSNYRGSNQCVISDGVNVRIENNDISAGTIRYRKF